MRPKNKTISAQDTHAQVSREKLLDAAISLVNESGMSSLTIRNICDKAGISTGILQPLRRQGRSCFLLPS